MPLTAPDLRPAEQPRGSVTVPLIVGSAWLMQTLDTTVVTTALPAIANSLHEDPIRLNLAITAYLLSLAVFVPVSGWVADKFGARRVFCCAIAVFTIGSMLCGLSSSLSELVAARVLQGLGGAMMIPVGRLIILKSLPKSEYVEAMSYLTIPAMIGPVAGPLVGGFIVTYYSWPWIFYMNVPICLIGITLVVLFVPDVREEEVPALDFLGFLLTGLGLAGIIFFFEIAGRGVFSVAFVSGVLASGLACMALYVLHARRIAYPIVDLRLFRTPTFSAAVVAGGPSRMGIGALPFLLALLLQLGFGLTPFASGMLTFVSSIGSVMTKFTVNSIVRTLGFRSTLIVNSVITAIFLAICALFRQSTPHSVIIMLLLIGGFFRALQFAYLGALTYADVAPALMSNASSVASMAQQLFASLGITCAAIVLHITVAWHGAAQLTSQDISPAFIVLALATLISPFLFLRLEHHAGYELSGRPAPILSAEVEPQASALPE